MGIPIFFLIIELIKISLKFPALLYRIPARKSDYNDMELSVDLAELELSFRFNLKYSRVKASSLKVNLYFFQWEDRFPFLSELVPCAYRT